MEVTTKGTRKMHEPDAKSNLEPAHREKALREDGGAEADARSLAAVLLQGTARANARELLRLML